MYLPISSPVELIPLYEEMKNSVLLYQITAVTVAPDLPFSQIFGPFSTMGLLVVNVRSASAYLGRNKELNIQERQKVERLGKTEDQATEKGKVSFIPSV